METAAEKGNTQALIKWRYGLQAGLADAVSKGLSSENLEIWVFKRIRNTEQCMKYILKQMYPMPGDIVLPKYAKGKRKDYLMDGKQAKKNRDRQFEVFLKNSNF